MKKKKEIGLPIYTKGEEIFNMVSHIVGVALGIVALVMCIMISVINNNIFGIISGIVYGVSMIILYAMSSIYHGLTNKTAKGVFRVLDHCTIYLLIAGTYTVVALSSLRLVDPTLAYTMIIIEWTLGIIAIILTAIDLKKYQVFSMICYIGMGWLILIGVNNLVIALTPAGFILLLIGGILYTIGAVLYGLGKKHKYMHSVFHIFVVLGSLLQFLAIVIYAL